ncbi:hypothetical protein GCM10022226_25370 [Sphaerisporangium flaviroseum]|uniref:Fibronectin type-III domain-containing protein n=1 Tax=Sphaerisporangium flaviroseum TaxID=509199 RepID=A0ABP7HYG4_9ACTN
MVERLLTRLLCVVVLVLSLGVATHPARAVGQARVGGSVAGAAGSSVAASAVQPGPGQYYGARVRVLNNVSIAGGATSTVKVTGVGTVPASGVSSIAVNVAARGAGAAGGLVVYPSELTAAPAVTGARYRSGVWDDQLLIVKAGSDGSVKVKNTGSAAASVYLDIHGYTVAAAAATAGAAYVPLNTSRLISNKSVPANAASSFQVTGIGGIPSADVAFVALTLVVKGTAASQVTAYPSGATKPVGSNIDYRPSAFISNLVIVAPGPDGKITIHNGGAAALTVYGDAAGYFAAPPASVPGTAAVPVTPARIVTGAAVAAGAAYTVAPLGKAGVPASGVGGVGVNITANSTGSGLLRIHPSGQSGVPSGGSFSYQAGDYWSTFVPVKLGTDGKFVILNTGSASISLSVDTFGYHRPPAAPSPPTNVTAQGGGGQATVSWGRPVDGGAMITGYTVVTSPGEQTITVAGTQLQATVTGLTNGTAYTFTVTATNAVGTSDASQPSPAVTPGRVPGAPTDVIAAAADGSASVGWQAPADTGTSPITKYTVTEVATRKTVTTSGETTALFTALENGKPYSFEVKATNATGDSVWSALSNTVTPQPLPLPGRPFITDAQPADARVELAWAPPPTGARAVTKYRIAVQPGGTTLDIEPETGKAVVKDLVNGTAYSFTVTAINANGAGQPSLPAYATPGQGQTPLQPTIVGVIPQDGRIDVRWLPTQDGGAPVTAYKLSAAPGEAQVSVPGEATTASLTGLSNGTAYAVRLVAVNKNGTSSPTLTENHIPAAHRAPGPPVDLEASATGHGQAEVTWSPPADPGTSAISEYVISASPGGKSTTSTTCDGQERCSVTIGELDPTADHTFTVAAVSPDGTGAVGEATAPIRPHLNLKAEPWQLSPVAADTLTSVAGDGILVFDNPPEEVTELTAGRYVIIPPTRAAPDGLLRKIVKTVSSGSRIRISSVPASLTDFIVDGDFTGQVTMGADDLADPLPGSAATRPEVAGEVPVGAPLRFPLHYGIGKTGRVDADLVLAPKLVYNLRIRLGVVSGRVALHNQLSGHLRVQAARQEEWTKQFDLGKWKFVKMIKAGKSRIPVVGTSVLTAKAQADASGAVTLAGSPDITAGVAAEITGWKATLGPVFQDRTVAQQPQIDGTASARLELTAGQFISLAGTIGLGAEVNPYLLAKADVNADPWWWIRAGAVIRQCFSWFDQCTPAALSRDMWTTLKSADGPFRGISITPGHATTTRGQPVDFNAITHNAPNGPVRWEVVEGPGSIDQNGVYVSGTAGDAVVRAVREDGGVDDPTAEATVEVDPNLPGAPIDVKAAAGPLSAHISWQPPPGTLVGITGYTIVATPLEAGHEQTTGYGSSSDRAFDVRDLAPDVLYALRVYATSQHGTGPPSETITVKPSRGLMPEGDARNLAVDAGGIPDTKRDLGGYGAVLSGDGRYAFFAAEASSNLMPPEAFDPDSDANYVLRKDIETGEIDLVSRRPDGHTPAPVDLNRGLSVASDGSKAAYITMPDGGTTWWDESIDLIVSDVDTDDTWLVYDGHADVAPAYVRAISGDGEIALFELWRLDNANYGDELIWRERGGASQTVLLETPEGAALGSGAHMAADGETIAYAASTWLEDRSTYRHEIRIYYSSTKTTETSVEVYGHSASPGYHGVHFPKLSPDGSTLAYSFETGFAQFDAYVKKVTATGAWGTHVTPGYVSAMSTYGRFIGYWSQSTRGGYYDAVAGSGIESAQGFVKDVSYDGSATISIGNCSGQCVRGVWYQRYDVPGTRGSLAACNVPDYGYIGEHDRRTGIRVKLCFPMPEGSSASRGIKPPGWPIENEKIPGSDEWRYARGHLLAKQLGGSGTDARNLVTLFQLANRVLMDPEEDKVAEEVKDRDDVYYYVSPVYSDAYEDLDDRMPDKIHLVASGENGFFLDACIPNLEGGTVTYDNPCNA